MGQLGFKSLTVDNWQQPGPLLSAFVRYSLEAVSIRPIVGDEWAKDIMSVELSHHVPHEVQRLFAVARGCLVYGYFYYPLYTLGVEQLFRVADAAVAHKCRKLGFVGKKGQDLDFNDRIAHLVKEGVITPSTERGWTALRHLRNAASHPSDQSILLTSMAVAELRRIAADVDKLFEGFTR